MIVKQRLFSILWSALKYLAIFVLIYVAISIWRAPSLPDTPALVYQNAHGQYVDVIADSHQKPVLVYFWGSWCAICRHTSPNVQALHDDGYAVLTVAVSSGSDKELATYMHKHRYNFITINDGDGQTFNAWQGKAVPSFVILSNGKIAQGFTGLAPLWSLKLRLWWENI